ncbi:MAG: hypothetical protein DRH08_09610 [Deltaproteobacteria bacterium]|nr:MAG: hypothetical protein DRH08_09610 [Deltaproteobacteria bacterium]
MILQLAVQGKLVPQDENDESASVLLGRIKAEREKFVAAGLAKKQKDLLPVNDAPHTIPRNWVWVRLGEVQDFVNGFAFKSQEYTDQGIGIVRIGDIQNGEIDTSGMKYVPKDYLDALDVRLRVVKGDLVIAMSGATTGKLGFNQSDEMYLLNQRVEKIILLLIDPQFACYYLKTKIQENLRISAGSAIPNLSTEQINNIAFPLPPPRRTKAHRHQSRPTHDPMRPTRSQAQPDPTTQ